MPTAIGFEEVLMLETSVWKARFADWLAVRYRSRDTRNNYLSAIGGFL